MRALLRHGRYVLGENAVTFLASLLSLAAPLLVAQGANDPRVLPWHSRKMAARLQSATEGEAPILLMTRMDAGHGGGKSLSQEIEDAVDMYAFVFQELDITLPSTNRGNSR